MPFEAWSETQPAMPARPCLPNMVAANRQSSVRGNRPRALRWPVAAVTRCATHANECAQARTIRMPLANPGARRRLRQPRKTGGFVELTLRFPETWRADLRDGQASMTMGIRIILMPVVIVPGVTM